MDDQIHIGSLTKAMTSVLLARLVADGAFANGWSTTIAEVFPELERKIHAMYHEVTLDELVRHRSGIARNAANWWAYRNRDIEKRRYRLLKKNLRKRPAGARGDFLYSNLGYMVAGSMAERVTGQSWEELMEEEVFGPLGMKRTGFGFPEREARLTSLGGTAAEEKPEMEGRAARQRGVGRTRRNRAPDAQRLREVRAGCGSRAPNRRS